MRSFCWMWERWDSTVRTLRKSWSAISEFVWPEGDQAQDVELAVGEPVASLRRVGGEPRPELGLEVGAPGGGEVDGGDQLLVDGLLEHVAEHAALDRLARVGGLVLHRQHDDPGLRRRVPKLGHRVGARTARHVEVEHQDVGLVPAHVAKRAVDVAGLGHHLEPLLGVEQEAQGATDDGVIVGKNDLDHRTTPRLP